VPKDNIKVIGGPEDLKAKAWIANERILNKRSWIKLNYCHAATVVDNVSIRIASQGKRDEEFW